MKRDRVPTCRVCGCTDRDSRACIAIAGEPCHWVEPDLCSVCRDRGRSLYVRIVRGNDNVAKVVLGGRTLRCSCTMGGQEAAERLARKAAEAVGAAEARIERYRTLSLQIARAVLVLRFAPAAKGGAA